MFTGIIETTGIIQDIIFSTDCIHFVISPKIAFDDLAIGDSVCVNGACLTVTHFTDNSFSTTAVPETLSITNLGYLTKNSIVNLERSLKLNARLGGHYVQGHVDSLAEIIDLKQDGSSWLTKITLPDALEKYIVNKGFITIDGMSITVIETAPKWFTVMFIPHTREVTIANQYHRGSKVNIEVDIISKYVQKLMLKSA
jgi:riboflavin synthase